MYHTVAFSHKERKQKVEERGDQISNQQSQISASLNNFPHERGGI